MIESEIKDWLNIARDPRPLLPEVIEGMEGIPFPEDAAGQMEAFTALLRCVPDIRCLFVGDVPGGSPGGGGVPRLEGDDIVFDWHHRRP